MNYRIQLPRELQWQHAVRTDPHRFKFIVTGRRSGKTTGACEALLLGNAAYPGALLRPGQYYWIGPDHTQTVVATRFLKRMLKGFARYRAQAHTFELRNGSQIVIKTAENEKGLRGEGLSGFVLDEAAFVKESIFKECLLPAVKDKHGFGILCTTPNGFNWAHSHWEGVENDPRWFRFNAPSTVNPLMTQAELDEEREILGTARFNQEFCGHFVSMAGSLFPPEFFVDVLVDSIPTIYQRGIIAVDLSLGRIKSDYQAVTHLGRINGVMYADCRLFRTSIENLLDEINSLYLQYQPQGVVMESNGFQALAGDAFARKYPLIPTWCQVNTIDKAVRIGRLAGPLARKELRLLNTNKGRQTYNQLRDFPVAEFDDGPDALEMAWRFFQEN